jgi:DNA-directed RNA polymerase subunit D
MFSNLQQNQRTTRFTLANLHVTYANTLRRLILTGVETVAFRSDMTATGTTTDVTVTKNDTPMTNEMLADRIGLLPIHVLKPLDWKKEKYLFRIKVEGSKDRTTYVTSSDFQVIEAHDKGQSESDEKSEEGLVVRTDDFFPKNPITGDACLIATLQPSATPQQIEIEAYASVGTGREHARFSPVSQCAYEYTPDPDQERIDKLFDTWLDVTKKAKGIDRASARFQELLREFNTMQIKRCFLVNDKGEPYSFNFSVETAGVLPVFDIVKRACQVAENMCNRYVNLDKGDVPSDITISSADARIIGFDFLFRGHDHTLGNLLQTWLVEHHIEGSATPKITYAGYSVPHPLRDEMVLRIGVQDGQESTARLAVATAARDCALMFQQMSVQWSALYGEPALPVQKAAKGGQRSAMKRIG